MKKITFGFLLLVAMGARSQSVSQKLTTAFRRFEEDSQMRYSLASLYVIHARTGEVVFDRNSRVGLTPASTQKVITAASSYELLGRDFRYRTEFWTSGPAHQAGGRKELVNLFIKSNGDPTLGSWRYRSAREEAIAGSLAEAIRGSGASGIGGNVYLYQNGFDVLSTPGGWIVDDIGNYYGAGANAVNWKENQFDLQLIPGAREGDPVAVRSEDSILPSVNRLRTGRKGSGDNAYVYYDFNGTMLVRGTAESPKQSLTISATVPSPAFYAGLRLTRLLRAGIGVSGRMAGIFVPDSTAAPEIYRQLPRPSRLLLTHHSPSLDSINYWFLRRSINLYGEALMKTFAFQKTGSGTTDEGVALVRQFWAGKGIDRGELNMVDGSGLSPLNRVTTHAQVEVLRYAKGQSWYEGYVAGFPEYNGMKMKSGSISGARGYCGYHRSGEGTEYIFSFIVNNYSGSASSVVQKMYRVLDELK